jgi:hypothetical protein
MSCTTCGQDLPEVAAFCFTWVADVESVLAEQKV